MPGRLRGARAGSECLRRAVGRGRGGRPLLGRVGQDEEARAGAAHGQAADARGGRAQLGQARAPLPRGRPGLRGLVVGRVRVRAHRLYLIASKLRKTAQLLTDVSTKELRV